MIGTGFVVRLARRPLAAVTRRGVHRPGPIIVATLAVSLFGTAGLTDAAVRRDSAGSASASLPTAGTYLEGIDVSHWQNTINWAQVKAAGKSFAIIKASEDTDFVDPAYVTNRAGAAAAGIRSTAYHFARPETVPNDAVLEADHFVAVANLQPGDITPALDLEVTGGLGTAALQAWVLSWLNEVYARLGVRAMIYTSPNFWKNNMGDTSAFADAGYKVLWVAHWTTNPGPTVPGNNWGGRGWTFWQYSNCGNVSGISGCVDLDRYNGGDLSVLGYDPGFRLTTSATVPKVKQGASASLSVAISRTNFTSAVTLAASGLPAGATAAFPTSPTSASTASVTVTTAKSGSVTPTGTFTFTITGTGGGLTRTVNASVTVTDGVGATVTPARVRLANNSTVSTTAAPAFATWVGSDPSGIASYQVQRQAGGGSWSWLVLPRVTVTSVSAALAFGRAYRYRVRATDGAGNQGAWTYSPINTAIRSEQSSSAIHYGGTWRTYLNSSATAGSTRYATAAGASASFTFNGSSIDWVSYKGPNRGSARVYIDGVYSATVNLHARAYHARAVVAAYSWGSNGTHTIRIEVVGTKAYPRVDVDAFVVVRQS